MNSTDNTTTNAGIHNTNTGKGRNTPPSHSAYHVREGKNGGKAFWTRIGAAWSHNDGQGFNIQIDVVPLDGRITLRVASEKES